MAASTVNRASFPSNWLSVLFEGAGVRRTGGLALPGRGGAWGRAGSAAAHRVSSRCEIRRTATSWVILIPQYTQRGFQFSQGMGVARGGDAAAVEFAGVVQPAKFFERLTAMIIGRRIARIGDQHGFEFRDRARPFACVDVFHCPSVTSEFAGGVLGQNLFEKF